MGTRDMVRVASATIRPFLDALERRHAAAIGGSAALVAQGLHLPDVHDLDVIVHTRSPASLVTDIVAAGGVLDRSFADATKAAAKGRLLACYDGVPLDVLLPGVMARRATPACKAAADRLVAETAASVVRIEDVPFVGLEIALAWKFVMFRPKDSALIASLSDRRRRAIPDFDAAMVLRHVRGLCGEDSKKYNRANSLLLPEWWSHAYA